MDHGIPADRITLLMSESAKERMTQISQPTLLSGSAGATNRFDPLGNDIRQSTPFPIQGGNNFPVGETAEVKDYQEGSPVDGRPIEELDPNPYHHDYRMEQEPGQSKRVTSDASYDPEPAAKHGLTTTTLGDAASAAKFGVAAGLGVGALAAVAALTLPGIGIVIGGGALATALAGIAASAGAGAFAGGVVGYLKDQGVPGSDIHCYQSAYDAHGALLSVQTESESEATKVEVLLAKYLAQNVKRYGDRI